MIIVIKIKLEMITLLPLDIRKEIAKFDENVWMMFVLYDPEFKTFAYTKHGKLVFQQLFVDTFEIQSYRIHENSDVPYCVNINKFNVTVHEQGIFKSGSSSFEEEYEDDEDDEE